MGKVTNVLLVGVGGQGTILASKVLSLAVLSQGYDVKMNEIHGMSQRGGSVITHVRFGEEVNSPIVEPGEADVIVAFEELEAMRYLPFLKETGTMIVDSQQIHPASVSAGKAQYPANISEKISKKIDNAVIINAVAKAKEAGNLKAANVVLLGVLAKELGFPVEAWEKIIEEVVPAKLIEVNKKAFKLGFEAVG
ncbi:MAG: indolepyruvate oxidoreductase subunit beta [Bacillota bacterium]|nr:indolepyruvate oxidoreductase subunit beta [Bacillota bacterium]